MGVTDKLPGRERGRAPGGPGFEALHPTKRFPGTARLHLRQGQAGDLEAATGRTRIRALEATRALEGAPDLEAGTTWRT